MRSAEEVTVKTINKTNIATLDIHFFIGIFFIRKAKLHY